MLGAVKIRLHARRVKRLALVSPINLLSGEIKMQITHWINSYRDSDGNKIVLWQRGDYQYEVEQRFPHPGKILARLGSYESAIAFCQANYSLTQQYDA